MVGKMKINSSMVLVLMIVLNLFMYLNKQTFSLLSSRFVFVTVVFFTAYLMINNGGRLYLNEGLKKVFVLIALLLAMSVMSYWYTRSFDGLIMLALYLVILGLMTEADYDDASMGILLISMIILVALWMPRVRDYFDNFMAQLYTYTDRDVLNANTIGQVLTIAVMVIYGLLSHYKRSYLFRYFVLACGTWGVINCKSRSCLIAILFFSLAVVLDRIFLLNKKRNIIIGIFSITFLFGLVFPFLWVFIIGKLDYFSQEILGKGVNSGREILWNEMIRLFRSNPIGVIIGYGHYDRFHYLTNDATNIHNWFLRIVFQFGIGGFVLLFVFYYSMLDRACKRAMTEARFSFIIAFVSIIIICFFEISLSYYLLAVLCNLPLALGCNKFFDNEYIPNSSFSRVVKRKRMKFR